MPSPPDADLKGRLNGLRITGISREFYVVSSPLQSPIKLIFDSSRSTTPQDRPIRRVREDLIARTREM